MKIYKFFKDLSNGVLDTKDLSFPLMVQAIRRKYMMDAILFNNVKGSERQAQGERILNNVKQTLSMKPTQKIEEKLPMNDSEISYN